MHEFPETRYSLLAEVKNPENRDAWEQFAAIYRPVIFRIALTKGMQDADANDLAQQVLMSVAGAIGRWNRHDESTKFRHWLSRITRNAIINALTRRPKHVGIGATASAELLADVPCGDEQTEALIAREYRRELYLRAAEIVRKEVTEETWQAFEMTVVRGIGIDHTSTQLGKSVGAIYSSRSRVMLRLKSIVKQLEAMDR